MEGGVGADGRLHDVGSDRETLWANSALAAIRGKPLGESSAEAAAAALGGDLAPMSSAQGSAKMRLHLQRVLTRRALAVARERASGRAKAA
jgi:CO/xanthine dehydrogenase FAD-binding subunit